MTTAIEILDSFIYVRYELDVEDSFELSRSIVEVINDGFTGNKRLHVTYEEIVNVK